MSAFRKQAGARERFIIHEERETKAADPL